ncbi:hypothetical protein [Streptomyces sp. NBC_00690]|uniref:hypothetical protein n=1 Tax=Streptomyces sp. NBC_00690 TaxID=2975808 RepID=UPI002E2A01FC|nr:hypothetical protein [Streptomyces sp. NBC_00690]
MTDELDIGQTVRDLQRDRVGVVMARLGPYLQLRPLGGGRAWDADPVHLQRLNDLEELSARIAEINARSRRWLPDH